MNLKKEIYKACKPPDQKGRDSFLSAITYPKLTYLEFVLLQICYIRKRIWLVSGITLLVGIGTTCVIPNSSMFFLWAMSALIPFLAVLTAAEISRANIFGMAEIEAGCRFALHQVMGARMIILGVCNFAVIAVAAAVLGIFSPFGIVKSALYIFTPYVLVNGLSLAIFSRIRGQDGVYLSSATALAVSLAGEILLGKDFYDKRTTSLFFVAFCTIGAILMTLQIRKILVGKDNYYGIKD
ncbi:MAG: hypothetical protein K2K41_08070 [Ruminiclostridium sp.]|nr:hypothetical protein [Ruminiclostridium sp.]